MAAVITVTGLALAADGKTLTATLGGGVAPYSVTSAAGLRTHTSGGGDWIVSKATPGISITTITIVLQSAWLSGTTVQFDLTSASTITDSAANTVSPATNVAVTNSSTVTGAATVITANPSLFNFTGTLAVLATSPTSVSDSIQNAMASWINTSDNTGYSIEYVINVTAGTVNVDLEANLSGAGNGTLYWQIDGGAQQNYPGANIGFEWISLASSLGVGKHLLRHNAPANFWTRTVRISGGGTASISPAGSAVALFTDNWTSVTLPSQVSPVARWGTYTTAGGRTNNSHPGFEFLAGGNFQGLDVLALAGASGSSRVWGVVVDPPVVPCPNSAFTEQTFTCDIALNGTAQIHPIAVGLSPGNHTVELLDLTCYVFYAVRAWNGSGLTAQAASAQNQIVVSDITNIADGDWLVLDSLQNEEVVHVLSHAGSAGAYTLTLTANLAKTHAAGVAARNPAPVNIPTLTSQTRPTFGGSVLALGDSLTHAAATDINGSLPAGITTLYDVRCSWAFMACRDAGWEFRGGATQGWTAGSLVGDNASNSKDNNKPATIYVVMIGTNDFGAGNTTIATYTANIQTIIGQIKTAAPNGCTILFSTVFSTPYSTTDGNGNTKADFTNAIQTAINATAAPGYKMLLINFAWNLSTATTANPDFPGSGPHPYTNGTDTTGSGAQNRLGKALLPYLTAGLQNESFMIAAT